MEKFKGLLKNKKIMIGVTIVVILCACIGGYFIYDNHKKQEIINKMSITFNEVNEIEYGTKDYDVKKELVKEVNNATLKGIPKIDTSKIGKQTLKFVLTQNGLVKEIEYQVNIKDTKAPEITLKENTIEITVNDEFSIYDNIESVKDPIDGDITLNEDVLELNKKATGDYNNLDKQNIKDDTKVAEKSLNEFLIEDIQDKEEKNLYLKNCYYIEGNVDVAKVGEYKINVVAVDKNGLKSTKEFTINVKEKEIEQPVNSGANYISNGSNNSGGNSSNGSNTISKGSISSVIATAQAQVGKPYVAGGRGPNSFDCDGLVLYSFTQNGYSMPNTASLAGYSIGTDLHNAQAGDIIVTPNHVRIYLGGTNSVQAKNPSQGIRSGYDQELAGWFQYYDYDDPNVTPVQILDIRRVR